MERLGRVLGLLGSQAPPFWPAARFRVALFPGLMDVVLSAFFCVWVGRLRGD